MGSRIWLTINFLLIKENFYIRAIPAIYVLNQTTLKAEAMDLMSVHKRCQVFVAETLDHRVVELLPSYRRLA